MHYALQTIQVLNLKKTTNHAMSFDIFVFFKFFSWKYLHGEGKVFGDSLLLFILL